jgi:hypothetical protein
MMKCVAPPPMLPQPAAMALAAEGGGNGCVSKAGGGGQMRGAISRLPAGACTSQHRHPPVPTILVLNMLVHLF